MVKKKFRIKNPPHSFLGALLRGSGGFTLFEVLTIVAILIILALMAVPYFRSFEKEADLINSVEEIINTLRLVQSKTLASEGPDQWGVRFTTSTDPHEYTVFRGESYNLRQPSFDETYQLPANVEIYEANLTGGEAEVVFDRLVGTTNQWGTMSLRLKSNVAQIRQIVVKASGKITSETETVPSDTNRIKDSRHVHFDYTRQISTATEVISLIFTYNASSVTEDITIATSMKDSQIYWEGSIDVDGETQYIKIHTHYLNDPEVGTRFCVHRDRRYNTKALSIEIDGDATGDLIQYTVSGETTPGTSIYVSSSIWQ